jgi:hypothetical protein
MPTAPWADFQPPPVEQDDAEAPAGEHVALESREGQFGLELSGEALGRGCMSRTSLAATRSHPARKRLPSSPILNGWSRYGRAPKPQDPAASDVGLPAKAGFTQHEHRPEKRG